MARQKLLSGKKSAAKTSGKPKRSRRKRRMGSAGKVETVVMNGVAVGAGALAVTEINNVLDNMIQAYNTNTIMSPIVQFGLGVATVMFSKNDFIRYMGLGAMGKGVYSLGTMFIPGMTVSGPQQLSYAYRRGMGDPRLQFVAGPYTRIGSPPNPIPVVAGVGARRQQRRFTNL